MCLAESLNLIAKYCRECMQEGGWKLSNPILIRWLGHPSPNSLILHYRSIPCLNTLVGSGRYLITMLKYRPFHYLVELYLTFFHCWAIPNPNTLLSYTQSYYFAEQFPKTNTLLHCWAIPNPNTLLWYSLSWNIAEQFPISILTELYPILTHCWGIP